MSLIDRIETAMMDDDSDREKNSARLIELYEQADTEGRAILDDALMHLCGWRMETLLGAEEWSEGKADEADADTDAAS
jgi:hypothetical protein